MPVTFRLEDLISAKDIVSTQAKEDAVDIQAYKTLTVQVRKPVAAVGPLSAILYIQHSATLDEDAFVNVTTFTFDLKTTTTEVKILTDLLRYIRWTAVAESAYSTYPQFMIDIVARES